MADGADHERAAALHREGLRWCEELGLWPEVSSRLAWLGWIAMQSGDNAQARAHGERPLAVATEQGFLATLGRPAFTEELEAGSRLTPDEARTRAVHALFGCAPGHREPEPLPRHSRPTRACPGPRAS